MEATVRVNDKGAVYFLDGTKVRGSKRDYLFEAMLVCEVNGVSKAVCMGNIATCEREFSDRMAQLRNARQWLEFLKGRITETEFITLKRPMDRAHYRHVLKEARSMTGVTKMEKIKCQEEFIQDFERRNYKIIPIKIEN